MKTRVAVPLTLALSLLFGACSDAGKRSNDTQPQQTQPPNTWNDMTWNEGEWG